jgi:hypothetical protein
MAVLATSVSGTSGKENSSGERDLLTGHVTKPATVVTANFRIPARTAERSLRFSTPFVLQIHS